MTTLTEPIHPGEFIASEDPGRRSRDQIVIASGAGVVIAGAVLGKILMGAATPAAVAGNTGLDTIGAVVLDVNAKVGVYRLICILAGAAGKFTLEDPTGIEVGVVTVAVAFTGGGLTFTIADNATHAAVGDQYTITVAAGSGKYLPIVQTAVDGSQHAAAINFSQVDATSADQKAVGIVRGAEVASSLLNWGALDGGHITTATAELKALGIIVRSSV